MTGDTAIVLELPDESALERLARAMADLARRAGTSWRVTHLHGELGAGKTAWVRAFLRSVGVKGAVRSPTFTLVEPYETEIGPCFHLDLYRLTDPEELEFLGIRDLDSGESALFVEWPERGEGALPEPDLVVYLDYAGAGRVARIVAKNTELDRLIHADVHINAMKSH